jgi:molybdenum cofactor cytidylyltransferase
VRLALALRVTRRDVVTLVGGGGKTTTMFRLADELSRAGWRIVTTMTTRIFAGQMAAAPAVLRVEDEAKLLAQLPVLLQQHRHVVIAGGDAAERDKVGGVDPDLIAAIAALPAVDAVIVEGDGSRGLSFKAPAGHEPVIPACSTLVAPIVGLDVIGQPLTAEHVHRPQLILDLLREAMPGVEMGAMVTPEMVAAVLAHPQGGGKGAPASARIVPFLNKAEGGAALLAGRQTARLLLQHAAIDSVVIAASATDEPGREAWTRIAAVVLAAGEARRFRAGEAAPVKQLLPWQGRPLVAHVASQALACRDIDRVIVTTGSHAAEVEAALAGLAVQVAHVSDWQAGQSASVRGGLAAAAGARSREPGVLSTHARHPRPAETGQGHERSSSDPAPAQYGAVVFLLADQPGVTPELLSALVQRHRETLAPVVAPRHQGRRGNPVLFDRSTFTEFAALAGDIGARPIIDAHRGEIAWLDWPTPEVLRDIDTAADYAAATGDG